MVLETAVLSEIVKTLTHRGLEPQVYFWRTSAGTEVDIVVEVFGKLVPIEVKLSATPRPAMASSIRTFRADFGDTALPGYVVHPGDIRLPLGSDVTARPFTDLSVLTAQASNMDPEPLKHLLAPAGFGHLALPSPLLF